LTLPSYRPRIKRLSHRSFLKEYATNRRCQLSIRQPR